VAPSQIDGFVPVTAASELAPGAMRWVVVDRERVLLANVDGAFYALRDACGHRQMQLSKGRLAGHVVAAFCHRHTRNRTKHAMTSASGRLSH
jgi:nitrite reductase/ring-hydroxylating ferredoxin subunit